MSYNQPAASPTKYGTMKVGNNLTATNGIVSANGISGDSYYGKFYSSANQTNTGINTALIVAFPSTALSNEISTSGSTITFNKAGVYTVTYELQAEITSGGGGDISVWASNGTNLVNSNTLTTLEGGGSKTIINKSFLVNIVAGETFRIQWSSAVANMRLTAIGTQTGPIRPATNSANFLATLVKAL
jgi:hypothetical protein